MEIPRPKPEIQLNAGTLQRVRFKGLTVSRVVLIEAEAPKEKPGVGKYVHGRRDVFNDSQGNCPEHEGVITADHGKTWQVTDSGDGWVMPQGAMYPIDKPPVYDSREVQKDDHCTVVPIPPIKAKHAKALQDMLDKPNKTT